MSLLRPRAIEVSFESTLSERRPAAARAWFVRLMSFDSDAELNVFASQARVEWGAANRPSAVIAKATAVIVAKRVGSLNQRRTSARRGRMGRGSEGPGLAARGSARR